MPIFIVIFFSDKRLSSRTINKKRHPEEYYFVYPSQLGINPGRLIREMDKYIIKHCKDPYNIISNNCAKNVAQILKKVGVKDIDFFGPDALGVSYPTL